MSGRSYLYGDRNLPHALKVGFAVGVDLCGRGSVIRRPLGLLL